MWTWRVYIQSIYADSTHCNFYASSKVGELLQQQINLAWPNGGGNSQMSTAPTNTSLPPEASPNIPLPSCVQHLIRPIIPPNVCCLSGTSWVGYLNTATMSNHTCTDNGLRLQLEIQKLSWRHFNSVAIVITYRGSFLVITPLATTVCSDCRCGVMYMCENCQYELMHTLWVSTRV